jgi:hypothetical protein
VSHRQAYRGMKLSVATPPPKIFFALPSPFTHRIPFSFSYPFHHHHIIIIIIIISSSSSSSYHHHHHHHHHHHIIIKKSSNQGKQGRKQIKREEKS